MTRGERTALAVLAFVLLAFALGCVAFAQDAPLPSPAPRVHLAESPVAFRTPAPELRGPVLREESLAARARAEQVERWRVLGSAVLVSIALSLLILCAWFGSDCAVCALAAALFLAGCAQPAPASANRWTEIGWQAGAIAR